DICGDQCESSQSTTFRDRREGAFGATNTYSRPQLRARTARRVNQRQARQHHEQIVARDGGGSLSISIRKSHSGNQTVVWTYLEGSVGFLMRVRRCMPHRSQWTVSEPTRHLRKNSTPCPWPK
ncbi:MAG: hypothetical protein ACPGQS_10655, partial [Bradymonadia bacterium]